MAYISQLEGHADAVLQAIAEHDRLGRKAFLQTYHFGEPKEYYIKYGGNGILLRGDLHTLFDLRKIAIAADGEEWKALLTKDLRQTSYRDFHGIGLWLPSNAASRPNVEAINQHRRDARL